MSKNTISSSTITEDELLNHWQGHRRLTRKVIDAFPEDKLFNHRIGEMRPFAEIAMELIDIAVPGVNGIVSGKWQRFEEIQDRKSPKTKEEILKLWDWSTEKIDELWAQIPEGRFRETEVAFEIYEGTIWSHFFYFLDNEIHHRGQGYVYLRSLGVEPPFFWER